MIASLASASSCGSPNAASQSLVTALVAPAAAVHCDGRAVLGNACLRISSRSGAGASAQPARMQDSQQIQGVRIASVQLQDQVVRVGADAQDHLAQNVQERGMLGVD